MERELPKADIVIGVCTKNCEDTIGNVLQKVDAGLSRFYRGSKSLIIVSDLSNDATKERVEQTITKSPVFFATQEGGPGKGNGIRTIFKLAEMSGARMVALVDGDLTSIDTVWIKALVEPLEMGFDLSVPRYERHKYDSVITNHIIYPFVTSMYGTEIRQPIGGEFGLSMSFVRKLLKHPGFPEGFGIDIFITTTALAEDMRVAETALGVKSHTSTKEYKDFEKLLIPMFNQVVSTLFDLTLYNKEKIRHVRGVKDVRKFGHIRGGSLGESVVDRRELYRMFQRDYRRLMNSEILSESTRKQLNDVIEGSRGKPVSAGTILHPLLDLLKYIPARLMARQDKPVRSDILSEESKDRIRKAVYGERGQIIDVKTWVNAVFDAFRYYKKYQKDPRKRQEVIDVLRMVWLARFSSFVRQTRFMDTGDAECVIRGQVDVFNEKKAELLRRI